MYPAFKRLFDVFGACLLLLGLLPLLGLVGVAILLTDGRPIFFTQVRAGRDGAPFRLYKFRTLQNGPKNPTRPLKYVTTLGAPLRRWAIDELPQLWNVLRGDMSLVGPRPVPLNQVHRYGPRERGRLRVRPGLTGWAQVQGRNALSWSERIDHDLWYVHHRTLKVDLQIVAQTPLVLLTGTGVYGSGGRNASFQSCQPDSDA